MFFLLNSYLKLKTFLSWKHNSEVRGESLFTKRPFTSNSYSTINESFVVYTVEHSNSRFEYIRFYSLCESIRIYSFCKKSAFRFSSVVQFFLLICCIVSAEKNIPQCTQLKAILCRKSTKNSYAMHTIKITPNLLFEYQCTSGKFIRLPNRMESKKIDSVARIE